MKVNKTKLIFVLAVFVALGAAYVGAVNVGIGTSNPTHTLTVGNSGSHSSLPSNRVSVLLSGGNGASGIGMYNTAGSAAFLQLQSNALYTGTTTSHPLVLRTSDLDRMIIDNAGNVGIGTVSPIQTLDVAGNVKANQFCIGANCISSWPTGGGGGSQWTTNGPNIYYNGGVGIGTATPTGAELEVADNNANNDVRIGLRASAVHTGQIGVSGTQMFLNSVNPILFYTAGSERMRITNEGGVSIGTAGSGEKLEVAGTINANSGSVGSIALKARNAEAIWFDGNYFSWGYGGSKNYFADPVELGSLPTQTFVGYNVCRQNVDGRLVACSSSRKLKENIRPFKTGMETISQLTPVLFDWKADHQPSFGLIAEDVEKIFPLLVTRDQKGNVVGLQYEKISVLTINALKEQQKQIEELKSQNNLLEQRIKKLEMK